MNAALPYWNINEDLKNTLTFILAGGRGSRLNELTDWRVKPAVPFGGKYRIIDFVLSNCVNSDLRKIEILTQYKSQSLIRHVTRGWELFHPELNEFIECIPAQKKVGSDWYMGTANAIFQNIDLIRFHKPAYVLILAGDHIYKMDYRNMLAFHKQQQAEVTVASTFVPLDEVSRFGIIETDHNSKVVGFKEKPEIAPIASQFNDQAMASMGIYIFNANLLLKLLIDDARDISSSHDFGKDIIPSMIRDHPVYAYPFVDPETKLPFYWKDVGTLDSYWQASMDLIGISPELNLYDLTWPIRTSPTNSPPAKFIFNDERRKGSALNSLVAEGCIISGAQVEDSLLSSNVRVEENTLIRNSIILPNVHIGARCTIVNAIIDKECHIPDDTTIGIDPFHDQERFDRSDGGVTLVEPEMLGQQVHQIE